MKNFVRAAALLGVTTIAAVACGGGGGTSGPQPPSRDASSVNGVATFAIPLRAPQGRHASFLSPSVISATIAVNGVIAVTADLSPSSSICSTAASVRTCTIPLSAPTGSVTFLATLYDAALGKGNVLGIGTTTQTIVTAGFQLPITVGGVATTVVLSAQSTTLVAGSAASVPLTVTAKDAAGNVIAGADPFASPITLTDGDTSGHTHLSTTSLTSPSTPVSLIYDGSQTLSGKAITVSANGSSTTVTPVTVQVIPVPQFGFSGSAFECAGTPQVQLPNTYLVMITEGQLSTVGSTATYTSQIGEYEPIRFVAGSPLPSPSPTVTPVATPTPTPAGSPGPTVTLYIGTFTVTNAGNLFSGQQGGCFFMIALPTSPGPTPTPQPSAAPPNAIGIGFPNVGANATIDSTASPNPVGLITTFALTVNTTNATGNGNYVLDDGATGTITINGQFQFTETNERLLQAWRLRDVIRRNGGR